MKTNTNFSNSELQKIHSKANLVVDNHLQRLDAISNDIKILEQFLHKAAIPFRFIYILSESATENREILYRGPEGNWSYDGISRQRIKNSLVWEKQKDGSHRLLHEVSQIYEELEYDSKEIVHSSNWECSSSTPLIEAKAYVRLGVERDLPKFYEHIITLLESNFSKEKFTVRSPYYEGWDELAF